MCVNNLPRVALDSVAAGIRTRDLLIASPAPYCYATEPHNDLHMFHSSVVTTCHLHHFLLQQNPEWLDILVLAYPGCPGN